MTEWQYLVTRPGGGPNMFASREAMESFVQRLVEHGVAPDDMHVYGLDRLDTEAVLA